MQDIGPRPKSLPIAPLAPKAKRNLPLADQARDKDHRWRPIYAVWEVTLQCDLSCRHCGSRAGRERPDELSTEEALDLVDQMADLGTLEVTLIGGEAYLREDWTKIAKRVRERGMQCTMTTGGRGLHKERVAQLKDAGIQSVSVSIDGFESMHDQLRGVKGSFKAAMSALENLREAGVHISCNTQICRPNMQEVERLFPLLCDQGIHSWQVQLTVAMGRAADEPHLLLEPYMVLETMPMLARLKKNVADPRKVRVWPGNNIGYFGPYEEILRGTMPRGHMASCGAGRSTLGIEANGDIKGCPSLTSDEWAGGNIRDNKLVDIWERSAPLRYTRDRTVADLSGYCHDCYYADTCRAGCMWTTQVLFGKPGNNPFCHHRALEFLKDGKRERIVRTHAAPGLPFDHGLFEIVVEDWPADELARVQKIVETGEGFLRDDESTAPIPFTEPTPA